MAKFFMIFLLSVSLLSMAGCYSIQVDANVPDAYVGTSPRVDSSQVPKPETLEQANMELQRAYSRIQHLERKICSLKEDKSELKEKNKRLEDRLERYEDKD